jgi:hypothetical protein
MDSAGTSLDVGHKRLIYVRQGDSRLRQKFTVAHEIGHLLLDAVHHCSSLVLCHASEERLCDDFAAHLLIPPSKLAKVVASVDWADPRETARLASHFQVNFQALMISLARYCELPGTLVMIATSSRVVSDVGCHRILAAFGGDDLFVPRNKRLGTMGLRNLEAWANKAEGGELGNGNDIMTGKTWRAGGNPRSGTVAGSIRWRAYKLCNGLAIAHADVAMLQRYHELNRPHSA